MSTEQEDHERAQHKRRSDGRAPAPDRIREALRASPSPDYRLLSEDAIVQQWGLSGAGPARYGWWAISPAGHRTYLGATAEVVVNAAREVPDA